MVRVVSSWLETRARHRRRCHQRHVVTDLRDALGRRTRVLHLPADPRCHPGQRPSRAADRGSPTDSMDALAPQGDRGSVRRCRHARQARGRRTEAPRPATEPSGDDPHRDQAKAQGAEATPRARESGAEHDWCPAHARGVTRKHHVWVPDRVPYARDRPLTTARCFAAKLRPERLRTRWLLGRSGGRSPVGKRPGNPQSRPSPARRNFGLRPISGRREGREATKRSGTGFKSGRGIQEDFTTGTRPWGCT